MSAITLVCPICGYQRVLDVTENYTQADLVCPSDEHEEAELVRVPGQVLEEAHEDEPPAT